MTDWLARHPFRWRYAAALVVSALAAATCPVSAQTPSGRLVAVRYWSLGDVTRVAIETDSEIRYKSDRVPGPDRIFFDLTGIKPKTPRKGVQTITVGDKLLKQIRIAETVPGTTRVVLDVAGPAEYSASQLTVPDRLIIELRVPKAPAVPPLRSVTGTHPIEPPETKAEAESKPVIIVQGSKPAPAAEKTKPEVEKRPSETAKPVRTAEAVKSEPRAERPKSQPENAAAEPATGTEAKRVRLAEVVKPEPGTEKPRPQPEKSAAESKPVRLAEVAKPEPGAEKPKPQPEKFVAESKPVRPAEAAKSEPGAEKPKPQPEKSGVESKPVRLAEAVKPESVAEKQKSGAESAARPAEPKPVKTAEDVKADAAKAAAESAKPEPKPAVTGAAGSEMAAVRLPSGPRRSAARPKSESSEKPEAGPAESKTARAEDPGSAAVAQEDSRGSRSLIRALGLKIGRVVLDPGHGGHDTGTIGPGGLAEKDLVLDVARRLGALIIQRMGSEVIYTRKDDTFVPLEARTEFANEKKADIFLSIHANSSRQKNISGPETFYLNFTASGADMEVAALENATSQRSIYELQELVQKIARKEKVQESREFAGSVQTALYSGLRTKPPLKNRGVKKAPFIVLIGAQMPSVLAEIAFLSNPKEEKLLRRPDYRQKIAESLFKGLAQYANTLSHFQVARSGDL